MIQRIQTLWLLLASITLFMLFVFPYAQFSDSEGIGYILKITGIHRVVSGESITVNSFLLQTLSLVVLALLPILIIFSYKVRKKQRLFVLGTLVLTLLFAGWTYASTKNAMEAINQQISLGNIGFGAILIPISVVFLFLAQKGISRDEKLIRSADRLR